MKCLIKEKLSEHKYRDNNGYLICVDSVLARTGKQRYLRSEIFADAADDDSEIEVDRKPEEVFSEKTLASFENCPLCVEHPDEDVNPDNYKDYAVGFVRDVHKGNVDGQDVILGTLVITDGKTIEEVENGQHTDLSCGYDCDIEDSANPQQRNIRGNHVALCEQGRAGNARIVDTAEKVNSVKDEQVYYKGFVFDYHQGSTPIFYGFTKDKEVQKIQDDYIVYAKNHGHSEVYQYVEGNYEGFTVIIEPGKIIMTKLKKFSYLQSDLIKAAKEIENTSNIVFDSINDVEPRQGESKEDFIARFMHETKEEYPDEKQRLAVAYSYWEKKDMKDEKIITVTLEGKTYKAIYNGMSSRYPDMADVYIPELAVLNSKYTPADDLGNHPKDGKYYIRKERIHDAEELPHISKEKWNKIPSDYKTKDPVTGKRQAFAGSLGIAPGGTTLLTEGKHFIIDKITSKRDSVIKDEYPKLNSRQEQELRKYAQRFSYEMEEVYDGLNSRVNREGMSVDEAVEDLKETMVAQKSLYDSSIKDSNTVRDSIREGETYTNKNGVQLKILGINTDVTGKKYVTYRIKNDTYNYPIENVENMLKANYYTKDSNTVEDSSIKDSCKDDTYTIQQHNGKWYYEIKEDDGFTHLVGPYTSMEEAIMYFKKHRPNETLTDEESTAEKVTKNLEKNFENFKETRMKDDSDLSLLREYFKEKQPSRKMELRNKLRSMGYKEGISGVNSSSILWVELNGKKYEVKNLSSVTPLDSIKDSTFVIRYKDLYNDIKHEEEINANSINEAIELLKKAVGLRGIGTANVYVERIENKSSREYYPRAYGKLNSLTLDSGKLKDSCKKDSLVNIIKVAKVVKKYGK